MVCRRWKPLAARDFITLMPRPRILNLPGTWMRSGPATPGLGLLSLYIEGFRPPIRSGAGQPTSERPGLQVPGRCRIDSTPHFETGNRRSGLYFFEITGDREACFSRTYLRLIFVLYPADFLLAGQSCAINLHSGFGHHYGWSGLTACFGPEAA